MRIKFLVLLALFCLSAHAQRVVEVTQTGSEKYASGKEASSTQEGNVKIDSASSWAKGEQKQASQTKISETKTYNDGSHEVEFTQVINKKQRSEAKQALKTKVEVKTETNRRTVEAAPCSERLKDEKLACESDLHPGFKPVFTFKDNKQCEWECNFEALPTEKPKAVTRKVVKKIVKKKGDGKKGGKGGAAQKTPKKECSGEKKIKFSNCLIKLNGLIAWGDKAKNFDKKFEKLLAKNKKKAPKKGGRRNKPKSLPPQAQSKK